MDGEEAHPPTSHFRQAVQMHSDWINDMILCNYNQTRTSFLLYRTAHTGGIDVWRIASHHELSHCRIIVLLGVARDAPLIDLKEAVYM